jgi:hypothetical protein
MIDMAMNDEGYSVVEAIGKVSWFVERDEY